MRTVSFGVKKKKGRTTACDMCGRRIQFDKLSRQVDEEKGWIGYVCWECVKEFQNRMFHRELERRGK